MAVTAVAPTPSPSRSLAMLRLWPRALVMLLLAAIAAVAVLTTEISAAVTAYRTSDAALAQDVQSAHAAGYSDQELQPVLTGIAGLHGAPLPRVGERLSFYQRQRGAADDLRSQLATLRVSVVAGYRQQLDANVEAARTGLAQARAQGVDDGSLAAASKTVEDVAAARAAAASAAQLRRLVATLTPVAAEVDALVRAQASENTRVDQAVAAFRAAHPGDIEAIRHTGQAALAAGRNDGALAGFLKLKTLDRYSSRLEAVAGALGGGDFEQVARAAALAQVRDDDLHNALAAAMPDKVIAVSLSGQHLWAYEHGKVTMETDVTTGRPALPTDIGPMSVLRKSSPWKMHSPWGRGSPYWYPDTVVRKVLWFTDTGEGLHDAVWEPLSLYGPGGQYTSSASHGCIHLPGYTVDTLFDWAPVGTPVIVIPGDGSPTASQIAADTIDLPSAQYVSHGS